MKVNACCHLSNVCTANLFIPNLLSATAGTNDVEAAYSMFFRYMTLHVSRRLTIQQALRAQQARLALSNYDVPAGLLAQAQRVLAVATASSDKSVEEQLGCASLQASYICAVQHHAFHIFGS